MARTTTATRKPRGGDDPAILYAGGRLVVYANHTNELFVKDTRSGATMRISSYGYLDGGLQFTTDGRVEPIRVTNMIGWRISPR